jgi:hypothetical protein
MFYLNELEWSREDDRKLLMPQSSSSLWLPMRLYATVYGNDSTTHRSQRLINIRLFEMIRALTVPGNEEPGKIDS